jgi:ribose transport system permease protein
VLAVLLQTRLANRETGARISKAPPTGALPAAGGPAGTPGGGSAVPGAPAGARPGGGDAPA